jgi:putative sterol carrier protein
VSVDDFYRLLKKEMKSKVAFTRGKMKIKGDVGPAMALRQIF